MEKSLENMETDFRVERVKELWWKVKTDVVYLVTNVAKRWNLSSSGGWGDFALWCSNSELQRSLWHAKSLQGSYSK